MLNEKALLEFASPYYENKDIMHNMWHIEAYTEGNMGNSDYCSEIWVPVVKK